jgi:hypothetical protein
LLQGDLTQTVFFWRGRNWDSVSAKHPLGRIKEATFSQLESTVP